MKINDVLRVLDEVTYITILTIDAETSSDIKIYEGFAFEMPCILLDREILYMKIDVDEIIILT